MVPSEIRVVALDEVAETFADFLDEFYAFEGFARGPEAFFALGGNGSHGWAEAVDGGESREVLEFERFPVEEDVWVRFEELGWASLSSLVHVEKTWLW
jgi:hypothetical protein